ncbi:MAG TPA: hypothetical protein ENJ45_01605, partial [Phaeodactylibacter sp.]|nr:hypothetical protein [Phaeodactylibacter sp.]
MKKQIHTLILPLLCLLGLSLYGQKSVDDVQIKVYAFEEGLSHRDVYQVLQEDSGFLWIGSRNGLNRFDSKNFTHIPVLPSAEERPVVAMHKAKDGQLWLSLSDQLVLFDLNTLTGRKAILQSTQIQHSQSDNIKHTLSFHTIHSDGDKGLWTCSYDSKSGMSQLQYSSSDHKLIPLISCKGNFEKRAVGKWNDRIIFAYDTNTLLEVDDSGEIYHRYSFEGERTWISQIQNQGDSLLWALSNEGQVYRLPKGSTTFKKIPISKHIEKQSSYESLWVADNGDIWVGGRNALWWYQAATDRLFDFTQNIKDYLKHNARFRHIYEDQTGVIWVSSDFGLIKLTFPNPLFAQYLYGDDGMCGASACSTRGITEDDDGNIYISFYSSIYKLHPYTDKLSPLFTDKELDNPPFGLLHHQGKLYTGNGKCIDLETEKVTSLLDMPLIDLGAVILDHEGDIWFGYRNRIYIYNPKTKKLRYRPDLTAAIDTQTLDISYLYQSPYDLTIWVASLTNGLFQLDKYKGLLAHYDTEGKNGMPLLHNKVNGIYEDRHQILWVATGKGLHRLDQERKHMNYYTPEHNGLTHSFLNGLLSEGDSVLWLSTDNGLTRFSIATEKGIGFKKEDGLTANEFNRMSFYKSKDGRMYFGGLEGVNAFYPGEQFL